MNTEQKHHSDRFQLGRKANPQSIRRAAVNFNKLLERMGYKGRMTGHGFRGLASTILHEHGYNHDLPEKGKT
jgi:hypothetical protein